MLAQLPGEGDESSGIDPARKKDAHGDITDEVGLHGIEEGVPGELGSIGVGRGLREVELPELVELNVALLPGEGMASLKAADVIEEGERFRDGTGFKELGDGVAIQLGGDQA
jgi:hypothetical protein